MRRHGNAGGRPTKGRLHKTLTPEARKEPAVSVLAEELPEQFDRLKRERDEALQQQVATSKVLRVIRSSPTDVQPVFDMIAESAARLCNAQFCFVYRFDGQLLHFVAHRSLTPEVIEINRRAYPAPPSRKSVAARAVLERTVVQISDVAADPEYGLGAMAVAGGYRSAAAVPIVREGLPIGSIAITRAQTGLLPDRQIELMKTFAEQAVIAIENVRLFEAEQQRTAELSEALEQQTATSEVLQVISSSPGELKPVFESILDNAVRICGAKFGNLWLREGDGFCLTATHGAPAAYRERLQDMTMVGAGTGTGLAGLVKTRQAVQIADLAASEGYRARDPLIVVSVEHAGTRTLITVPMFKENELIGAIAIYRQEVRPFTDKQIELVMNFAAQAVIAIENTRLLNELRQRTDDLTESLQQQTPTSGILEVISNSPTDTQPVFDAIVRYGLNLFPDAVVAISLPERDLVRLAAISGADEAGVQALRGRYPMPLSHEFITGTAILDGREIDLADAHEPPKELTVGALNLLAGGYRAMTVMPMMRADETIGAVNVIRCLPGPLSDKQRELLRTFADQAVIAIENVRLFDELKARTDDLAELLQQQTATADVLKVISRSAFDLETVLDTLLKSAGRLCDANMGVIVQRKGDLFCRAVSFGLRDDFAELVKNEPVEMARTSGSGRALVEGKIIHILDIEADPEYTHPGRQMGGFRTLLGVPMVRDEVPVGVLTLMRADVHPFTEKQIKLVSTFADQAAIAIENVRLFDEVQERTEDLAESLQQQTATADVLKVISRSTFDLQTVLYALVESAKRLCLSDQAYIYLLEGKTYRLAASCGFSHEAEEFLKRHSIATGRNTLVARTSMEGQIIHIEDVLADPAYTYREAQKIVGFRSVLGVPMMREGTPIGVMSLSRSTVQPFTPKQIDLVSTFADQAVIAIENVRLFESVEARTRELAKSLEDLRAAQDRLVQTEKLASLGQLTAGIAHEIKNPLNFVNNFSGVSVELIDELQETLSRVKADDKTLGDITELTDTVRDNLDKIIQHGKRADSIVKNMLLHSREGSGEHRPIDINSIVEESLNLAYHGARAEKQGFNITLERSLDPAAGQVDAFPQELTRVLINMVSNGFYATTKRKGLAEADSYEPTLAASTKDLGDHVEIRIRDNGTGIPPEVKERIFNPFFTTKPVGEGTGLGLSISHDIIVKQHAGRIEVDSKPGEYTEFRIILPRTAASLAKSGTRT